MNKLRCDNPSFLNEFGIISDLAPTTETPSGVTGLDSEKPKEILFSPGTITALHTYSRPSFDVFFRRALDQSREHMNEPEGAHHIRLVAQIVREMQSDPLKLQITPPEKTGKKHSFWEKKHIKNQFSCWGSLIDLLPSPHLQSDDWMIIFKALTKSIEGTERENGMALVMAAMQRPDIVIEAIMTYPKIFRSSRGPESSDTALMAVATGQLNQRLFAHQNDVGRPGLAVSLGVQIVRALQAAKVKAPMNDLLFKAAAADLRNKIPGNNIAFEIFSSIYGAAAMRDSASATGEPILHWAVMHLDKSFQLGLCEHLLDLGFDAGRQDLRGRNALVCAVTELYFSAELLHLFDARGALGDNEVEKMSRHLDSIKDPQSRAYITSRSAVQAIDKMIGQSSSPALRL